MKLSGVRLSICLSVRSIAALRCGGFAAERRSSRRCQSTVSVAGRPVAAAPQHGTQQQIASIVIVTDWLLTVKSNIAYCLHHVNTV